MGPRISAIARTGPDCVSNATSTKEPCPSEPGSFNNPPVAEMVWSLALACRPSSKRIAARTEAPSWTRAARREGCGWGKWVIRYVYYGTRSGKVTGYVSRVAGFPRWTGVSELQPPRYQEDAGCLTKS